MSVLTRVEWGVCNREELARRKLTLISLPGTVSFLLSNFVKIERRSSLIFVAFFSFSMSLIGMSGCNN